MGQYFEDVRLCGQQENPVVNCNVVCRPTLIMYPAIIVRLTAPYGFQQEQISVSTCTAHEQTTNNQFQ